MKYHELKCWPQNFNATIKDLKLFEIRKNDRDFKVGDILRLMEYHPELQQYTGENLFAKVTYIVDSPEWVKEGFVVMGTEKLGFITWPGGMGDAKGRPRDT
ncbi:MAG: DUF3850 domain-containing protein [Dethiobacter sp.]|nr:DUF3850 domain-containing protein [Dethiobacter sp.]MBS3898692.1 DUF3850 domain-containing protein [Dethiobacter sp.]